MPAPDTLLRYVLALAAVILSVTVLHFGRELILLVIFSGLFASLLLPAARRMERVMPRWAAALLTTLALLAVVLGFFFVIGWQLARFGTELPVLQERFGAKGEQVLAWIEDHTDLDRREQTAWFNAHMSELAGMGGKALLSLFSGTGAVLALVAPIPFFVFLLLMFKDRFRSFFLQMGTTREGAVLDVMVRISALSRKYMGGVLTVAVIFGTLLSGGFLAIGLKYAVLLGFLLAVLNVVPYLGAWVGSVLPVLVALVTKDGAMHAVAALGVVLVVQFLDNNVITPKVVGSSVSINPLASLVALFGFGMLWGVAGMLLAIPLTGMLKVVCDSLPSLRPWGYLLGEEIETPMEKRLRVPFLQGGPGKDKAAAGKP